MDEMLDWFLYGLQFFGSAVAFVLAGVLVILAFASVIWAVLISSILLYDRFRKE